MSPAHSSPGANAIPGCCENAASARALGSSPPWVAQDSAAAGALTAASLLALCQQAPAKKRFGGWHPAVWPLTLVASIALTALSAVWASRALSALSA
jgi:hypothetical protein